MEMYIPHDKALMTDIASIFYLPNTKTYDHTPE